MRTGHRSKKASKSSFKLSIPDNYIPINHTKSSIPPMKILPFASIALSIVSVVAKPMGTVNAMLKELNWFEAWSIIKDYNSEECNENETATKLSKYFAEHDYDFGYEDLTRYLSQMTQTMPVDVIDGNLNFIRDAKAVTNTKSVQGNLVCQWAISKGFDPLIFYGLWTNYNANKATMHWVRQFRTLLANPESIEDYAEVKGVVLAASNFKHEEGLFEWLSELQRVKLIKTKDEIFMSLEDVDWGNALTIISAYGNKRGQNKRERKALTDYFITTFGHDLREYLSKIAEIENPNAIIRNLICQWAIDKGFDPLVYLKLYVNYTRARKGHKENVDCIEYFKTFLKNPNYEKVKKFKDAIFPVVNPELAKLSIFRCRTEYDESTHFFHECTGCLLRKTEDY